MTVLPPSNLEPGRGDVRPAAEAGERGWGGAVVEYLGFLGAFLRAPRQVGAISPSSSALARAMLVGCDLARARCVVELGPGTGVFTREMLRRVGPETRLLAFELNTRAVERLRTRFPRVEVIHDSAENLGRHAASRGLGEVDCVISGLPWAVMSAELQRRIMEAVVAALRPGGRFSTFAYLHALGSAAGRRYLALLKELLQPVTVSRPVWWNLPPAVVYRGIKPVGGEN